MTKTLLRVATIALALACTPAQGVSPQIAASEQSPHVDPERQSAEPNTKAYGQPTASDFVTPTEDETPEDHDTTTEPDEYEDTPVEPVEPIDPFADEGFRLPLPAPVLPGTAPAMRHANLSPAQCRRELKKLALPFLRQRGTKGVANALRVDDALNGIRFIAPGKASQFGILDCRLALALNGLSEILLEHEVVSVRVDNFYRRAARLPGSRKRSQHAYGLAMDVTQFTLADGRELSIEEHWGAPLGDPVCGPDATLDAAVGSEGVALRNLVCAIARSGLFHHMLTPSYNLAHRDHLHLDIKRDAKTSMLR
jgi:hypothetical protein